jgi:antitoxin component of RelBE/YafQ-DinJ toxin-antitoxin module
MGSVNIDNHTKTLAKDICEEENRNISNLVQTLIKRYHKKLFVDNKSIK